MRITIIRMRQLGNRILSAINKVIRLFKRSTAETQSALTSLEAWVLLVDDVDAALAANQTVVAVTSLKRFERVLDLHFSGPQFGGLSHA